MAIRAKSGEYMMADSPMRSRIPADTHHPPRRARCRLAPSGPIGGRIYRQHLEWHMYGKPIARHPKLRVVGCHLGSNEEHLDQLAKRLDTYPNFAVDLASRVRYLTRADRETVREFVTKYQDRLIYPTEFSRGQGEEDRAAASLLSTHEREWTYFVDSEAGSLGLPGGDFAKGLPR